MPVRERGRAVALILGALAILGTLAALVAGPATAVHSPARSGAVSSATGLVATGDQSLATIGGHALAAASRAAGNHRHSPLGAAAVPAGLTLAALVLTGLVALHRDRRLTRRTRMALRGRAPPAPALA